MRSRIAYIVSQYPKVSHTFIRREVLALENQGFEILRISLCGWDDELADEEGRRERMRTRHDVSRLGAVLEKIMGISHCCPR